jgi:hypothetical protein
LAEWQKAVERALKANKSGVQVAISHATDEAQVVRDEVDSYKNLQPTAPVELVAQTSTYIDVRGYHRGRVIIGFPAVTLSTTAEPLTVTNYQLAAQAHDASWVPTEPTFNIVATSDGPSLMAMDFTPGSKWKFKARASAGNFTRPGQWSAELQVTIVSDTTPPPQTSTPVGTVVLATMKVAWDGLAAGGGLMPADLERVELAFGLSSSPTTIIDTYYSADPTFTMVPKSAYNVPHYFRLRAVDTSGNIGPWSTQISLIPVPLVDVDIIQSVLDGAKLTIGTVATAALADQAVNTAKLQNNAVDQNKLANQAVSLAKLDTSLSTTVTTAYSNASTALANAATADGKAGTAQTAADKAKAVADAATAQAQNTVPDSTFALGSERWDSQSFPASTTFPAVADAHRGANVLQMTANGTLVQVASDYQQPVTQGQIWEIAGWVRVSGTLPTAGDVRLACIVTDTSGVATFPAQVTLAATALTTTWQRMVGYYTVPAGIAKIAYRMRLDALTTSGTLVQWSDVSMRDVTTAKTALDNAALAQSKADTAFNLAGDANTAAGLAQTSASGKNNMMYMAALPSGTGWADGDTVFIQASPTAPITAQYRWTKTGPSTGSWGSQTLGNQVLASLDLGKATVGTLDGKYVTIGTLSVDRLMAGFGLNVIPDPVFVQPAMTALRIANSTSTSSVWSVNATTGNFDAAMPTTGNYYFRPTGVTQTSTTFASWIPVRPGERWRIDAGIVAGGSGFNGDLRFTFRTKDGSATVAAASPTNTPFTTSGTYSYDTVVPDTAYWVLPEIRFGGYVGTASITPGSMAMYRMTEASMIVNGSITSLALATNAVTAKQLLVGDFANIAIGSDFEDASAVPWTLNALHTITTTQKKFGTSSLRLGPGTGTQSSLFTNDTRVKEGEQWNVKFWAYIDASFNGTSGGSKIRFGDQGTTHILSAPFNAITRSVWTPVEMTVTALAGDTSFYIQIQSDHTAGFAYIDDIQFRRVAEASLIQNLGVEKLVASAASINSAVIDKLWTDVVNSRKITTDMLVVTAGTNMVPDPLFQAPESRAKKFGNATGWDTYVSGVGMQALRYGNATPSWPSVGYLNLLDYDSTPGVADKTNWLPVIAGEKYEFSGRFYANDAGITTKMYVTFVKDDGTTSGWSSATITPNLTTPATERIPVWEFTIPANVIKMGARIEHRGTTGWVSLYNDGMYFRKKVDANLIVDGGILAKHLTVTDEMWTDILHFKKLGGDEIDVNDLTADTAWIGTLRGGILINDAVDTGQLKASAITSKHTITGATFQTVTTASRGIKINTANGFRQYDGSGNIIVDIGGAAGANMMVGDLMTSRPGTRGIQLVNSSIWGLPAIVYSYGGGTSVNEASTFMRYSIAGDPELVHRAPDRSIVGQASNPGFVRVEGDLVLSLGANSVQNMRIEQPFIMGAWSPVDGYHSMQLKGDQITLTAAGGNVRFESGSFYTQAPGIYSKTTGNSANVWITTDGGMFRSTSASKYKILPEVMELPETLLDVDVKNWIDLAAAEEYSSFYDKPAPLSETDQQRFDAISLKRIPGAIAEDVLAAGGDAFVVYGEDGEVEGLMYDRLALAQIKLLQQRGEVLAETLAEVLERLDVLES